MNEIRIPDNTGPCPDVSARHGAVVEIISALLRALKAYRLYLPSHPLLKDFVEAFQQGLTDYLGEHDDLCLTVGQSHIALEDGTVYENPGREESLAFRLFIHGVREITFHPGIPLAEVTEFLQVIRRTFEAHADADDLIATLWERDLEHVDFIILEDLFDDEEAAEYEAFLREGGQSADDLPPHSLPGAAPVRPTISAEDRAALPDLLRTSKEENERVALAVREETERDPTTEISALFPEIILHSAAAARATDLLVLSQRTLETLIIEGEFAPAAALHAELIRPIALPGGDTQPLLRQGVSTPGILAALRPHLAHGVRTNPAAVSELLFNLGPGVASWLLDRIGEPECAEAAAALLRKLPATELLPLLDGLPEMPLTGAVCVLRIVGDNKLHRALPALRAILHRPETQIRREAVLAIQKIGTQEAFDPLFEVLTGKSPELSILAARGLQHLPDGAHFKQLIPLVKAKAFARRSPIERNDILAAIARSGDEDCEDFLLRIASHRGLFRRQARDAVRAGAVAALAQAPSKRHLDKMEKLAKDPSPEVRRAAAMALRR